MWWYVNIYLGSFVEEKGSSFVLNTLFSVVLMFLFFITVIDREKCIFCGRSWKDCEEAQSVAEHSGSDKAILHGEVQLHSRCA